MARASVASANGGVLCIALALLTGCVSHGGLTRETMAACINEAGITGPYSASSTLRNDRMTFIVRPGPNVTEAQADIANACIARTIDGGLPGQPAAPAAIIRPGPAVESSCQVGGGVFQGGTGYCTR